MEKLLVICPSSMLATPEGYPGSRAKLTAGHSVLVYPAPNLFWCGAYGVATTGYMALIKYE